MNEICFGPFLANHTHAHANALVIVSFAVAFIRVQSPKSPDTLPVDRYTYATTAQVAELLSDSLLGTHINFIPISCCGRWSHVAFETRIVFMGIGQ